MQRLANYIFYFFLFWYACGVVLVGLDLLPSWLEWSNSVFIITAGVLGVIYFMIHFDMLRGMIISFIVFLTTFVVEYYGSSTQFLFGNYTYTDHFAPNVLGVPIAIGFAWVMVIATAHALLMKLRVQSHLLRALIGGLLALVMDLILDPVAFEVKQYWIWHESGFYYNIPWTNFFGWFLIAFIIHYILSFIPMKTVSLLWQKRLILLYGLIIIMFTLIGLLNGIYLASVIVLGVLLLLTFLIRKEGDNVTS